MSIRHSSLPTSFKLEKLSERAQCLNFSLWVRTAFFIMAAAFVASAADKSATTALAMPEGAFNLLRKETEVDGLPTVFPCSDFKSSDPRIRAIYFAGAPFRGKETLVFAWLGKPETKPGEKVPGIVLLHGSGGTAFESWVKLWIDRGYAAIAIDSFGTLPQPEDANPRTRNPEGGPPGGSAAFAQLGEPLQDQWPFHAFTAALRAHSLLRSEPGVDLERTGVTGISWGGYLAAVMAGIDPRLKFAIPVYGCGHYEDTTFAVALAKLPAPQSALWYSQWDGKNYISAIRIPVLWINGTNDKFFWPSAWQKSYREMPAALRTIAMRLEMKHGHPPAGDPVEVLAFADSIVRGSSPLPVITSNLLEDLTVTIAFHSAEPVSKAELNFTSDIQSSWPERKWSALPARIDGNTATAELPPNARVYFMTIWDKRGLPVSTEHQEVPVGSAPSW